MANPDDDIWLDRLYFKCDCTLNDHIVEFEVIDLDGGQEKRHWKSIQLQISPLLNPETSFWKRLWIAFRYIIKKEPRYSRHFDSVYVSAGEDLDRLERMIRRVSAVARVRKSVLENKSKKK